MEKSILNKFIENKKYLINGLSEIKHLQGQHDQTSHGRRGSNVNESRRNLNNSPTIAFHGSSEEALKSILKNGIIPQKEENRTFLPFYYEGERAKAVFMVKSSKEAEYWAESKVSGDDSAIIFKINIPKEIKKKKDTEGLGTAFYIIGKIPPAWIELYDIYKQSISSRKLIFSSHHDIKKKKAIKEDIYYIPIIIKRKEKI